MRRLPLHVCLFHGCGASTKHLNELLSVLQALKIFISFAYLKNNSVATVITTLELHVGFVGRRFVIDTCGVLTLIFYTLLYLHKEGAPHWSYVPYVQCSHHHILTRVSYREEGRGGYPPSSLSSPPRLYIVMILVECYTLLASRSVHAKLEARITLRYVQCV